MLFGAEKQCLKSGSQHSGLQGKSLKLMSYFTIITRDQIAKICWIIEKAREFPKNIYFCFIDYLKPLTVQITINCGKF